MATLPRQLLAAAEELDGYRAAIAVSEPNRQARQGHQYTPFFVSPDHVQKLTDVMESIELVDGADVVVLHPSADNGYPHTRPPNLICLSADFVKNTAKSDLANTLSHEAVHLHQRKYTDKWIAACTKEGWQPLPQGTIPKRYRDRCRINPDTFKPQPFWSWEHTYVPLPLFSEKGSLTLDDCHIKWMDLRNQQLLNEAPSTFRARYGPNPPQPEHPFELLAVEAARDGIVTPYALEEKLRRL